MEPMISRPRQCDVQPATDYPSEWCFWEYGRTVWRWRPLHSELVLYPKAGGQAVVINSHCWPELVKEVESAIEEWKRKHSAKVTAMNRCTQVSVDYLDGDYSAIVHDESGKVSAIYDWTDLHDARAVSVDDPRWDVIAEHVNEVWRRTPRG